MPLLRGERHSRAFAPTLITDPLEKAERESSNAYSQAGVLRGMIDEWLQPERKFRLRPSMILQLHRAAMDGLSLFAGNWRPAGVEIEGSFHHPVGAHLVPIYIDELCDYVNDNYGRTALHLAAYVMWRLNWIHPFDDGNGRTARATSYFVLCMRLGYRLPGTRTIPDFIKENRKPYYAALEAADSSCREGRADVSEMERLLADLLGTQLLTIIEEASGYGYR